MKSVLRVCGFLAGVALVVPAQAADLPVRKAAPVEYVRVCSQFGAGFFYIPGSDTCLKIAGRVRADYFFNQPFSRNDNTTSMRGRGYLTLDSYTGTDWGPVRATTRVYVTKNTGSSASTTLDWAYIQFAGITAGRLEYSFFDFSPIGDFGFLDATVVGRGAYHQSINALAYTASFGGGWSATVSLEDRTERQVGIGTYTPYTPGFAGFAPTTLDYAGQSLPDVVARLEWTQDWGTAVLIGALHQVRPGGPYAGTFNGLPATDGFVVDARYGYAVNAGVKVKLPMLADGDVLMVSGVWAYGASNYSGWTTAGTAGSQSPLIADAVMVPGTLEMKLSTSYSLSAGLLHYWTPSVRQSVFASYGGIDQQGPFDARAVTVGSNVIWSPVKALNIGAEVYYSRYVDEPLSAYPYVAATNSFDKAGTSPDNWGGRIRFQRDF
ncbi:porin [Alsobacter sp. R-9]